MTDSSSRGFLASRSTERSFADDRQPNRRDLTLQRNELRSFQDKRLDERLAFRWPQDGRLGPPHWPTRARGAILPATLKEAMMAEAKLAPNLPDWMVEHANRYLASGGTDGHTYKIHVPGRGEITAPALLLTTTGRKSGEKFIFPLF
jgi:hypothetical protein